MEPALPDAFLIPRAFPIGAGWIEVVTGCMFSGKTEELIRRLNRARYATQRVVVFKPAVDVRYAVEDVVSHSEARLKCIPVSNAGEILQKVGDAQLQAPVENAWGIDLNGTFAAIIINDEFLHHRGQLYAYSRATGGEPPFMWGFDENPEGFRPGG